MPDSAVPLQTGPWGNLEELPTYIEPPDEYLPLKNIEGADSSWKFTGFSQNQLVSLFQSADLTTQQSAELLHSFRWKQDAQAIYVQASPDTILTLSPAARKQIYQPLLADEDNLVLYSELTYPIAQFDAYFADSGLTPETIALIKKLSFDHGDMLVFCDIQTVLKTLDTNDQKIRLLKTLDRKSTLFLRLHLTSKSNIGELENYWARAGWGLDLKPRLESLARLPNGARIDLTELLPPVPSSQIYTYPFPSLKPIDMHRDCHWTALNFFRDVPDDKFADPNTVAQTIKSDYYPEFSDPRYGDLVLLTRPDGNVIHSAIYIAADVVYTKNSGNFRDPFILMKLSDMVDHFSTQIPEDQKLGVNYLRNKYY